MADDIGAHSRYLGTETFSFLARYHYHYYNLSRSKEEAKICLKIAGNVLVSKQIWLEPTGNYHERLHENQRQEIERL